MAIFTISHRIHKNKTINQTYDIFQLYKYFLERENLQLKEKIVDYVSSLYRSVFASFLNLILIEGMKEPQAGLLWIAGQGMKGIPPWRLKVYRKQVLTDTQGMKDVVGSFLLHGLPDFLSLPRTFQSLQKLPKAINTSHKSWLFEQLHLQKSNELNRPWFHKKGCFWAGRVREGRSTPSRQMRVKRAGSNRR